MATRISDEKLQQIGRASNLAAMAGTDVILSFDDVGDMLAEIDQSRQEEEQWKTAAYLHSNNEHARTLCLNTEQEKTRCLLEACKRAEMFITTLLRTDVPGKPDVLKDLRAAIAKGDV